ncbi:MAG: family 43 glycosylhydrolase [Muribaculaceae bacterium]|nr:family 43 glycosylhydrolase [Muribaculaceae bacterium]
MKTISSQLLNALCLIVSLTLSAQQKTHIQNDTFWYTTDNQPIFTPGGGIFTFTDTETGKEQYYWYGVKYQEFVDYVPDALVASNSNITNFVSVTCYKSDDLLNWTFVNDIVTKETLPDFGWWMGRCGVAYVKEQKKYALFIQYNDLVGVFTCDTPGGNYSFHQTIDMKAKISTTNTGDQTVFTDEDGQSYLCYSKASGRNRMYISKIGVTEEGKIGLLDCNKIYDGSGREGNCMFKYKNKYYVCASDLYGWNASNLYYLEAENIYGPYTPTNSMKKMPGAENDYGHVTQTGFFFTVRGSEEETVIACGDRWAGFAGNGNGFTQWCPISFDNGTPYFNSLSQWTIDHKTGRWSVGPLNNYAVNWSFEADRVSIPSSSKPSQSFLRGWTTEVISGNKVAIGGANTPTLNTKNSSTDRKTVMGNFSMNISDKTDFKRKVYQTIKSTDRVKINDGVYALKAKVKCGSNFNEMVMYAVSPNKTNLSYQTDIPNTNGEWSTIEIPEIKVMGGSVEIGFTADGKPNAQCKIDDVELTWVRNMTDEEISSSLFIPKTNGAITTEYYSLEGRRHNKPQPGFNIKVTTQGDTRSVSKIYHRE